MDYDRSRKIKRIAKFGFLGVIIFFILVMVAIPLLAFGLPSPDQLVRKEGFSTKILDRNGKLLYDIFVDEKRTPVALSEIPEFLRLATVSIEDQNFYTHQGFDPTGYLRAVYNIIFKQKLQGGSTLTQQLVKKVFLSDERTIPRKIKEFVITLQVEQRYSKDEILQMYLNEVPYGGTTFGVQAAAEEYFGKSVKNLNLVESAFIAGLPQRPSAYSPFSSTPKAYIVRTSSVLRRMREDGHITQDQEKEALGLLEELPFITKGANFKAPHFVQYVQKILEERYGERTVAQGGLKVTTTLSLDLQEKAQEIVTNEILKVDDVYHITNGAAIVIDPETGELLAMVGSKNFNASDYDGQVNVTTSLRQPGSSIKPFTYATALKKGYTASTLLMDTPTIFPGGIGQPDYQPVNYDGKFRGPIQMRYALGNSMNIPAVKMLAMVGIRDVLETAYDMGLTTLEPSQATLDRVGLSLTLGGGEVRLIDMASGYSGLMNGGYRVDPAVILKVEDSNGNILEQYDPQKGRQVLQAEYAYIISNILSDNNARLIVFGPNSTLNITNTKVAVKTGTTNDRRDNWTIGGNGYAVVGVWVGNNDNSPMKALVSGVTGAAPIWKQILNQALAGKPAFEFPRPDGIVEMEVDSLSGYPAHDGFTSRKEIFAKGTQPDGKDPIHLKLKVCKGEGKLATPSDILGNNYEEKEYIVFKEEDPTSAPGGQNRWQEGILAWMTTMPDPRYNPPTEYCSSSSPINVEFISPREHDSNLPNKFIVKVSVQAVSDIAILELEVDNIKVRSFSGLPYEHEVDLPDGVHTIRAKAIDSEGRQSDRKITIGVNTAWDSAPAP